MNVLLNDLPGIIVRSLGPAGVYIMIGLGYNAIFAPTKVFNLAQGGLMMVAMFVAILIMELLGLPLIVGMVGAVIVVAVLAVVEERVAVQPAVRQAEPGGADITWAITTLAFMLILEAVVSIAGGTDPRRFPNILPDQRLMLGGTVLSLPAVGLFGVAIVTALALHLFYTRSRTGKFLTAMAENKDAASIRGVNVRTLTLLSFALGGAIAAMGGLFMAPLTFVYSTIAGLYTFKGVVAVSIGGMGSNAGVIIGGFLLAFVERAMTDTLGTGWVGVGSVGLLLVVLLIRPHGIMGHVQERPV
ncbi:MAG: branched-chain amino acid ABC transporter permease [Chloroflexota bacterium]|nr:MAG: branched-chain amino acid ABC transporter permease [Chloroflexota bacterium]